jgi:hypothetical protein
MERWMRQCASQERKNNRSLAFRVAAPREMENATRYEAVCGQGRPHDNRAGARRYTLPLRRLHRLGQRRDHLKQIADDAVIGNLKDGRVGIFVDGHDTLRGFHADQVLNRA